MFTFIPKAQSHAGRGWNFQIWRLLSQSHYGGGHFGEVQRAILRMTPDDPESWYSEWKLLGDELAELAQEAELKGHKHTASDRLFRASNYYRMAEFFLSARDVRKLETYKMSRDSFHKAIQVDDRGVEPIRISFERTELTGYWCVPRNGRKLSKEPAKTIVFIGGLDSTGEELYFTGKGLLSQDFNVLIVEGPGQGATLRINKLPSRYDYEVVGSAALDWLARRADVSIDRVGLIGMSLGGYYSLRIGAFEHRYRALVSWAPIEDYHEFWIERPDDYPLADHVQWVLGAQSMKEAREILKRFSVSADVERITTPTLLCIGELDGSHLALAQAHSVYEKLRCKKFLRVFTEKTGGALHCQQDHLTLANEVIGDWLTEMLS